MTDERFDSDASPKEVRKIVDPLLLRGERIDKHSGPLLDINLSSIRI